LNPACSFNNSASLKRLTAGFPEAVFDVGTIRPCRAQEACPLVLAQDGELDAVDGEEFIERETERHHWRR
jgi:hypothetical protein